MLAAVATAMPETLIPVIAILGPIILGGEATRPRGGVGGAILGAPFMLSTLAMFVTGVAILWYAWRGRRPTAMRVNPRVLGRDVSFFIVGYGIAIGTAFLPASLDWLKWVAAVVLMTLYAVYVWFHFRDEPESGDEEELDSSTHAGSRAPRQPNPRARRVPGSALDHRARARMPIVVAQVAFALLLIVIGAQVFVGAVDHLSTVVGLDPTILALIIAPIATELAGEVQ